MVSRKPEMYLRHRRGVLPLLYGPNGPTWVGSLLPVLLVVSFGILVNYRSPIPGQGRGVVPGSFMRQFYEVYPDLSICNWGPHQHSGQFNEIYPDLPITVGSTTPRIRHDSSASFSTDDAVRRLAV